MVGLVCERYEVCSELWGERVASSSFSSGGLHPSMAHEGVDKDDVKALESTRNPPENKPPGAPHDPLVEMTSSNLPGKEAGVSVPTAPEPHAVTDLSIDPELLTIYQQEVEQHLSTLGSVLDQAEQVGKLAPNEEIYRALHTIHGASRTADIPAIGELTRLMEKPLKAAVMANLMLDNEIIALYRKGQRSLQAMIHELVSQRRMPVAPADLEMSFKEGDQTGCEPRFPVLK